MLLRLVGLLLLLHTALRASEPVIVRLSFWMPPERHAEFAAVYERRIAPRLHAFGLVDAPAPRPIAADSAFCRHFHLPSAATYANSRMEILEWLTGNEMEVITTDFGLPKSWYSMISSPAAQDRHVPAGPGRGHWSHYGPGDGLPVASASCVVEDADGHLWFGTRRGVSRFDGHAFRNFGAGDGVGAGLGGATFPTRAILRDRQGHIWVATGQWWRSEVGAGVAWYDGSSWLTLGLEDGLPVRSVLSLFEDRDGALWFGTWGGGVCRYDGDTIRTFTTQDGLSSNSVVAIGQDAAGDMWFGTFAGGVCRYDGESFQEYGRAGGPPGNFVTCILADRQGSVWLGSYDGQVTRYRDGVLERVDRLASPDGSPVSCVFEDRRGDLWFGSGGGLLHDDGRASEMLTPGPGYEGVYGITEDREGSLWVAGRGGVSRYDRETFTTFTADDGLVSNEVGRLYQDREGAIWFGTRNGISRYDGRTFQSYGPDQGMGLDGAVSLFQDADGVLWIGGWNGANRFDGERFEYLTWEDGLHGALAIQPGGEGHLWMTSGVNGLTLYDRKGFRTVRLEGGPEANRVAPLLRARNGDFWVGTAAGAYRYDGERFRRYTADDGLGPSLVTGQIFEARDGAIWIPTEQGGLSRFDGAGFRNFGPEDGLRCETVKPIAQDRRGHLWFGGRDGTVSRYDGQVFQTLTAGDGLTGNGINDLLAADNGDMWIATAQGATRFREPPPSPPPVYVRTVVADQRYEAPSELSLPSSAGLVAFEFQGYSLKTRPDGMVYRYRLLGHDPEWRTAYQPRVEYQDLPAGDYTFEVLAVDRDLVYSEEPARVSLHLTPPYERYALMATLAVSLLLIAWQTRRVVHRGRGLRQANAALSEANEELRAANAEIQEATTRKSEFLRRMSHDLRSPMNAIIGYTRLVLRKARGSLDERQVRNLENIRTSSERLLDLINDILDLSRIEAGRIELQPRPTDLQQLVSECADTLAPLVKPGVELVRDLEPVPSIHTDPDRLRQVVMNLLGNAAKFTDEGSITVSLRPVEGTDADSVGGSGESAPGIAAEIRVADTGVGIPPEDLPHIFDEFHQVKRQGGDQTEGTGLGLSIARRIVELLGGAIYAQSEVGAGTTFQIRIGSLS